jgi:hypothetical protein
MSPGRTRSAAAARQRALKAVTLMRKGVSLTRAAVRSHTKPDTIRKYAQQALGGIKGGRYRVARSDRLARAMRFVDEAGAFTVHVRSSRVASEIAEYWNAVKRYLHRGYVDQLRRFAGKSFRLKGKTYRFLTDPIMLDTLGNVGELTPDTIYDYTSI